MVKPKLFTMRVDDSFFDDLDTLRVGSMSRSATVREIIRQLAAEAEENRVRNWTQSHPLGPPPPPRAVHTAPPGRVATATPRRQVDATTPPPVQPPSQPRPKLEGSIMTADEQAKYVKIWRV